jgi:hypothetical protein
MISADLQAPDGALRRLAPYSERIFRSWRDALASARALFWTTDGKKRLPFEPWLFCHAARAYAIQNLKKELAEFADIEVVEETIMSSVLLRTHDGIEVLFRKSDEGEIPVAGPSSRRQRWFAQPLPGLGEQLDQLHLIATWDVDSELMDLAGFVLAMPAHGAETRDSMSMHWETEYPETPEQRQPDLEGFALKRPESVARQGTSDDQ